MKLLRLKINEDFRSLKVDTDGKGFEVEFLRPFEMEKQWEFMPYCLAGRNGSGKSNILEALAAIFYHIECIYLGNRPEDFDFDEVKNPFGFREEKSTPDSYELEYLFPIPVGLVNKTIADLAKKTFKDFNAHISITKEVGKQPIVKWLNRAEFADMTEAKEILNRVEVKQFLPKFIIGYSSGENEILSLPFLKMRYIHFDEYEEALREETGYSQPEGRMVYLDTLYSQAVFLTNYLMQNEKVLEPIHNTIGIKSITQFRIIIQESPPIPKYRLDEGTIEEQSLAPEYNSFFELTENLKRKDETLKDLKPIDKLKNCATSQFYDNENKTLYLDYFVDADTKDENGNVIPGEMKKAFRGNFDNAFELFQAFQVLLTLNLYGVDRKLKKELYRSGSLYANETVPVLPSDKRIMRFKNFEIEKENVDKGLLTKSLSDGEYQFLHSMGICLLFKDTNSLFLLDEPETHFNPDWRAKFITTLRDCLKAEEKEVLRDLLITTHSPFLISDTQKSNVLKFVKDLDTGVVKCDRPEFNTFGASVNQITIEMFNKPDTIGDYANESISTFEKRFEEGENIQELIKEINLKMGDSIEKTILINRLLGNIKK